MNITDFMVLYKTIMEKFSWKQYSPNAIFKYYSLDIDTRTGKIYKVTLYHIFDKKLPDKIVFQNIGMIPLDEQIKNFFGGIDKQG